MHLYTLGPTETKCVWEVELPLLPGEPMLLDDWDRPEDMA